MNNWMKTSALVLAGALATAGVHAQEGKDKTDKKVEKNQEIIIRQNGDSKEKTTIVIDGDKVTVNGKPADELKDGNVTVLRRNRNEATTIYSPRARAMTIPRGGAQAFEDRANKALLGVTTEKSTDGAKISVISKESGAEKAGLKQGDVITRVGDKKIADGDDLVAAINGYKPNDKVEITYKRDGKETKTTATLGENKFRSYSFNNNNDFNFEMPELKGFSSPDFPFNLRKPKIGLQIQDVEEGKGVTVKDVDEDSPASKAGFKEGDVITSVNGKEVEGVDDLRAQLKDLKEGDNVKMNYKRNGSAQTAEIKLPKRLKTADL
ncbi:PDZ domain-containing protein [Segetibacter sp. 3557_3]|uniref:PDZ domain-containing protein n=1 Tax=Segetibacter sp. 3557_3 TaxID=2547429 RepID=UPI001058A349|nr:PDZ domain-containing protein [Segetibacter sp. 3557_3]TDH24093.1 PDZ domain-containing protein [Segetibacter sp. 3557_3]